MDQAQQYAVLFCVACGAPVAGNTCAKGHPVAKTLDYDPATWKRGAHYSTQDLNPATNLYITVEDRLRVGILNQSGASEVDVTGRLQRPDGQVIPFRLQLLPATNAAVQNFDVDLAEGFLLDLAVSTPTAAVRLGFLFVNVQLIRGAGATAIPSRSLLSNYVNSGVTLGWPEGPSIQSIQGAPAVLPKFQGNPAAGSDWSFAVPSPQRLLIQSGSAQLVTSAAAANRTPHIQITDGAGHVLWDAAASAVQAASTTVRYSFCGGIQAALADGSAQMPIPDVALMLQGWTINTVTSNLQAGDQWQNISFSSQLWLEL